MSDNMSSDPSKTPGSNRPTDTGSNRPTDESSKMKMPRLDSNMKNNLLRGLYMILFLFIGYLAANVILLITIFQFVYTIIFQAPNIQIKDFSKNMNTYFYDLIQYLTYQTDMKPFPFSSWPKS